MVEVAPILASFRITGIAHSRESHNDLSSIKIRTYWAKNPLSALGKDVFLERAEFLLVEKQLRLPACQIIAEVRVVSDVSSGSRGSAREGHIESTQLVARLATARVASWVVCKLT